MKLFHPKKKKREHCKKRKEREREKERRKTLDEVGIPISSSSADAAPWPAGIRLDRSPKHSKRFNAYVFDYDRSLTYFVLPLKTQRALAEPWTIYDFERARCSFVWHGKERKENLNWILWWNNAYSHFRNSEKKSTPILDWTIHNSDLDFSSKISWTVIFQNRLIWRISGRRKSLI